MWIFALIVGGTFWGIALFAWFAWGLYRLHIRGPEAPLGKAGWQALFWPPVIVTACLILAKAELAEKTLAVLPIATPPQAVENTALYN